MIGEGILALIILFVVVVGYVLLRRHYDRQIQSWIDAGLIQRKPRAFRRYSRYE